MWITVDAVYISNQCVNVSKYCLSTSFVLLTKYLQTLKASNFLINVLKLEVFQRKGQPYQG